MTYIEYLKQVIKAIAYDNVILSWIEKTNRRIKTRTKTKKQG